MPVNYRHWEKLDNTANVFPVIADDATTNTYRIEATLFEPIEAELLQEALDMILPKFLGFNLRLRTGFFWYYLEENVKPAPRVFEEDDYPCRFIYQNKNNSYLFRVTYYKNRINLEVFHALADGLGGVVFLRELCYQYLRLLHPTLREKLGDGLSPETSLNREDSFKAHFRKRSPSAYKVNRAFLIHGERLPYKGFGVIHGIMPISELKPATKRYGVSINEYIVSSFIYSTFIHFRREVSKKRPIRVAVPVNLRPYFDSITTKNFFVMVSAEFAPEAQDIEYTFRDICKIVQASLRSQITKEHLEEIFSYNVAKEDFLIARAVPLPIKNLAIRLIYTKSALANTSTITNVGHISVKDEYREYIKMFRGFIPFSKGQELKATIMSYEDSLCITFTSTFKDNSIPRDVFRQIALDGVSVRIETNGVYGEKKTDQKLPGNEAKENEK